MQAGLFNSQVIGDGLETKAIKSKGLEIITTQFEGFSFGIEFCHRASLLFLCFFYIIYLSVGRLQEQRMHI
ncbi:hypothetical protein D3C87_1887350 [compost metagenome]